MRHRFISPIFLMTTRACLIGLPVIYCSLIFVAVPVVYCCGRCVVCSVISVVLDVLTIDR